MTEDLDAYLNLLKEQDEYRVLKVLGQSKTELTELVCRSNSPQLFVRKTISRDQGIGEAYLHLMQKQPPRPEEQPLCIPRIYQCFSTGESLIVLMEHIEGLTLDQAMKVPDRLTKTSAIFPRLCDAVSQLHQWGLIHRDLKPSNILVAEDRVALIDFGIARVHKDGARSDTTHFGTSGYAPPEQYGFGQTSQRSDVYALGMVLGYCLTGVEPADLPAEELYESFRGLQGGTLERHLSVVQQATRPDPSQRLASAKALRDAFLAAPSRRPDPALSNKSKPTTPARRAVSILRNTFAALFLAFAALVLFLTTIEPSEAIAGYPLPLRAVVYLLLFALVCLPLASLVADVKSLPKTMAWISNISLKRRLLMLVLGFAGWIIFVVVLVNAIMLFIS